jgi:uncharacterized protein (TIGR02687 family)
MSIDNDQILNLLTDKFKRPLGKLEPRKVMVWYDPNQEFVELVDGIQSKLENAKLLIGDRNYFQIKRTLHQDQDASYLIYVPDEKPQDDGNWLLDILQSGEIFIPDVTTITMKLLGLGSNEIRPLVIKYSKFFQSKERIASLKKFIIKESKLTEEIVIRSMLAVLCNEPENEPSVITLSVLMSGLEESQNVPLTQIRKFELENEFWSMVKNVFGINDATGLSLTTLSDNIIKGYVSPLLGNSICSNVQYCRKFIYDWMLNSTHNHQLFAHAKELFEKSENEAYLHSYDLNTLANLEYLPIIEEFVYKTLVDQYLNNTINVNEEVISIKLAQKHSHLKNEFMWLNIAIQCQKNIQYYKPTGNTIDDLTADYSTKGYLIDRTYRDFVYLSKIIDPSFLIEPIVQQVTNQYHNTFMPSLASKWTMVWQESAHSGSLSFNTFQQADFFAWKIEKLNKQSRVFVIISDGLRYEIGHNLAESLNKNNTGEVSIEPMIGPIPTYTKLGMASLLPHKSITLNPKSSNVVVDEIDCSTIEQKQSVLNKHDSDSLIIKFEELTKLNRDSFRQILKGKNLIYIIHKKIDDTGESKSEHEIYKATHESVNEITDLITRLCNEVGATHIFITADHGFIYRVGDIPADQLIDIPEGVDGFVNKRFIFSSSPVESNNSICLKPNISNVNSNGYVITPNGYGIFKKQGGGRNYLHGGLMPQELIIPLVYYQHERGRIDAEANKVDVEIISKPTLITSYVVPVVIYQKQPMLGRKIHRNYLTQIVDGSGEVISDVQSRIANSASESNNERNTTVTLKLMPQTYTKQQKNRIVLIDADTQDEIHSIPVFIQISSGDTF